MLGRKGLLRRQVHDTGAHPADADHTVPSTYATAVTANASGAPVTPHARTLATQAVDSPFLRPYRRGFKPYARSKGLFPILRLFYGCS